VTDGGGNGGKLDGDSDGSGVERAGFTEWLGGWWTVVTHLMSM